MVDPVLSWNGCPVDAEWKNSDTITNHMVTQGDTISYIPCLRVALAEVAWDRFCVPLAALGGHRSGRGRLQQCHPQTRDVTILSSYFFSKCFLVVKSSFCMYWLTRTVIVCFYSDFPAFFFRGWHKIQRLTQDSVSTRFCVNLWLITGGHRILCHPLAYYRDLSQGLSITGIYLSCKPMNCQHFITWPPYRVINLHVNVWSQIK